MISCVLMTRMGGLDFQVKFLKLKKLFQRSGESYNFLAPEPGNNTLVVSFL